MTLTTLSYNTNKYFSPGWPHQQLQPQQEQEQQLSMNNKKLLYHQMKNLCAPKNELASDSAHATVTAANKLLHQHHASHHHHQQQQHNSTVPFWLGHEEETQIEFILKQYAKHFRLDIYEQSSMPSRSSCSSLSSSGSGSGCAMRPKEFIGKVVRQLSKNSGELSEGELITMDTVFLFFRDKGRSPDHLMAFARRYNLKTVWNKSDGTPVRFETVTAPSNRNSDSDDDDHSDENDAHCSSPYILYCLPVFGSKIDNDFRYYSADGVSGCEDICDNKVTYSDLMSQAVFKQRDTIRMVKSFSNPDFSLSEDGTQPEKTWNCDEYDEDGYDDENEEYEDYDDVDDEYDDDEDDLYRDFNYEVHSRLEQDTHNDYCYSISGRSCHSVGVLDEEPDELSGQPQGHSRPSYMDLLVVSSSSCPYSIYQFDFVQSADAAVMDQSNSDTEDQDDSDEESEEEEDDDDESEEDSDSDEEDWEEESDDDDE